VLPLKSIPIDLIIVVEILLDEAFFGALQIYPEPEDVDCADTAKSSLLMADEKVVV
jgi:hypothetical protein|tara:strand:- start:31 stop:198 length:168 start_codon:yes stop_codon:yes gene_type:complete